MPLYALGWTLEYEMFFYVIFAAAMRFRLVVGLPIIIIALFSSLVSIGTLLPDSNGPWIAVAITYFTRPIMMYFVIGMTIAVTFRLIGGPVRTRMPNALICSAACLALVATALKIIDFPYLVPALAVAFATCFSQAKASVYFSEISRISGDSSYSMYLTHSFVLTPLAFALAKLPLGNPPGLAFSLCVAAVFCLAIAWCSWKFLEVPISAKLRGKRSRRHVETAAHEGYADALRVRG